MYRKLNHHGCSLRLLTLIGSKSELLVRLIVDEPACGGGLDEREHRKATIGSGAQIWAKSGSEEDPILDLFHFPFFV